MIDWVQVGNGVAALTAALIWGHAVGPSLRISGAWSGVFAAGSTAVCAWFAVINLILGFGIVEIGRTAPLFRAGLAPLLLLPAFRHLAQRRVRNQLLKPFNNANVRGGEPESIPQQ